MAVTGRGFGFLAMTALLLIPACSGSLGDATTTPSIDGGPSIVTTTTEPTPITALEETTTSSQVTTVAPGPDVVISGGTQEEPEITVTGPEVFRFAPGDPVVITVSSTVDDEIHVHGYDLHFPAVEGEVTDISFTADVPGIFEVELESNDVPLFEIEVSP